jgi:hypothetical protein
MRLSRVTPALSCWYVYQNYFFDKKFGSRDAISLECESLKSIKVLANQVSLKFDGNQ